MQDSKSTSSFWNRIPLWLRAILAGLFISTLGVFLATAMTALIPAPYSLIFVLIFLWLYWKYFSGHWKPVSTQEFRKSNMRTNSLSRQTWIWASLAAIFFIVIEQSGLVFTFRLMEFPAEKFTSEYSFLETVPRWASWLYVISIAIVAAVCEEVGFRGYMQVPLEKKYGPIIGIGIVSIMFVVVHLHQAWSGPILIHIFIVSVLFGVIAYYSRSLIPGIIAHFIVDIFNFSFWWSPIGWQFDKSPIGQTGVDSHFITWTIIFIISIGLFILSITKLKSLNQVSFNNNLV